MAFVVVPRLRKILGDRQTHVDNLLDVAKKFSEKSETIENEAKSLLSKTKQGILEAEEKLVSDLEQRNSQEKRRLSEEILGNANAEIAALRSSSEEAFKSVSSDLDEFLELALKKIRSQER